MLIYYFIDSLFHFWYYCSWEDFIPKVENVNNDVEEIVESPVEWCRRMQDEADTVEDLMNYYKLAKMWMEKEKRGYAW